MHVLYPGSGADPGFFLGGGAPLRNDVTDGWGKQILKANTKKASSQGGVRTFCTLPQDPSLWLNWTLQMLVFVEGKNRRTQRPEKPLEQGENQQQTQPTYGTGQE